MSETKSKPAIPIKIVEYRGKLILLGYHLKFDPKETGSYFFPMKISWIKLALGGVVILGIPLIYFFSSSDDEKTPIEPQIEFVEQIKT